MLFRRDEAAEDLRRAAEAVDLEKRAAILGGGRKLPGPSLSDDSIVSLSKLAMITVWREKDAKGRKGNAISVEVAGMTNQLHACGKRR